MEKAFTLVQFLVGIICVGIILSICALPFLKYNTDRAGQHTGYVTAIEQHGVIFHNYTVYFKTNTQSSQEDVYCVSSSDTTLANQLKDANQTSKQVTIHYDGVRTISISSCSGDRILNVETDK